MELTSVVQELYAAKQRLSKASKEIFKLGEQKAVTENAYRLELSKEIAKLRAENTPTTLIPDLSRGRVAYLKLERDMAETQYKSALSAMRAIEIEINALQTISKYVSEV